MGMFSRKKNGTEGRLLDLKFLNEGYLSNVLLKDLEKLRAEGCTETELEPKMNDLEDYIILYDLYNLAWEKLFHNDVSFQTAHERYNTGRELENYEHREILLTIESCNDLAHLGIVEMLRKFYGLSNFASWTANKYRASPTYKEYKLIADRLSEEICTLHELYFSEPREFSHKVWKKKYTEYLKNPNRACKRREHQTRKEENLKIESSVSERLPDPQKEKNLDLKIERMERHFRRLKKSTDEMKKLKELLEGLKGWRLKEKWQLEV